MQTKFMGKTVTREAIIQALQEFSAEYPDPDNYENWLQRGAYIYAVKYGEKVYPPKHILSRATGIPTSRFNGGDQTNNVFRKLGFVVVEK